MFWTWPRGGYRTNSDRSRLDWRGFSCIDVAGIVESQEGQELLGRSRRVRARKIGWVGCVAGTWGLSK